jgi:hypothetical protein
VLQKRREVSNDGGNEGNGTYDRNSFIINRVELDGNSQIHGTFDSRDLVFSVGNINLAFPVVIATNCYRLEAQFSEYLAEISLELKKIKTMVK